MFSLLRKLAIVPAIVLPIGLALAGCDKPASQSDATAPQGGSTLPANLFLAEAPANAENLFQMKTRATDGMDVTVRARVGGRKEPFVDGRAAMTVMDVSVKSCKENPGDSCSTPWDYCCEPSETVAANSATVQVLGPDGKPLHASLKNAKGLKPLDEVIVKGKVTRSPDGKAVVINADGIYVKGS